MRCITTAVLLTAIVTGGTTSAAGADTPRCVSRHEYTRVTKGMTVTKVEKIFDFEGTVTGLGAPNELRYYATCTGRGKVQIVYSPRGRVISKGARFF
jgi:hypothetical protein